MYRVYKAAEGCDLVYCGERDTYQEACDLAAIEPAGLEKSLWATAQAAGHCAGMTAPDGGDDSEPMSWHGVSGNFCVVKVL